MKIKVKFKVLGKLFLEKNKQTNKQKTTTTKKQNNETKIKTQQTTNNKQQTATLKSKRIYHYIKSFYLFTAISQLLSTIFFLIAYSLAYCLQSVESCTKCSHLSNGVGLK